MNIRNLALLILYQHCRDNMNFVFAVYLLIILFSMKGTWSNISPFLMLIYSALALKSRYELESLSLYPH